MPKKKIGVKYCGGCNPRYERVEMIERVQSLMKNSFLFLRYDQEGLDVLVLVNGCSRACSNINLRQTDVLSLSVTGESDFENLMNRLRALDKKKDASDKCTTPFEKNDLRGEKK